MALFRGWGGQCALVWCPASILTPPRCSAGCVSPRHRPSPARPHNGLTAVSRREFQVAFSVMGKGSGRGGDGGSTRAEVRELVASFEDVSLALENERAAAAAKVQGDTDMRVKLVPESEIAELSKQIYATAKPYRGTAVLGRSMMYLLRESCL